MLAERCNLSEIYMRLLEAGKRRVTPKVAIALSFATGASVQWLMGKGGIYPILTPSGAEWTPKATELHPIIWKRSRGRKCKGTLVPGTHDRYLDEDYCAGEAQWADLMFAALCDGMGRIIYCAFKAKKTPLVIRLLQEQFIDLSKRFHTIDKWPGDKSDEKYLLASSLEAKMNAIAKNFIKNMDAELKLRPYHYPKP